MGIFTSLQQRSPYVPQSDAGSPRAGATLLGRSQDSMLTPDANVIRISGGDLDTNDQQSRPRRGVAPNTEPPPGSPEYENAMAKAVGHRVLLPNGSPIVDSTSDSGYLMSPVADLSQVAAAGRSAREQVQEMMSNPETAAGASPYFYAAAGKNVGQGGSFDYQREGNHVTGFLQLPHFRNVSNFNVGLYAHQAGMSLEDVLAVSGLYSRLFGRTDPSQPNSLKARTAEFIRKGFEAGASGIFDPPGLP